MRWLSIDEVIKLHRRGVDLTGEPDAIRSPDLLASAVDAPRHFHDYEEVDEVCRLAAIYAIRISASQAFVNGNKRAAWLSARAFCVLNGYDFEIDGGPEGSAIQVIAGWIERVATRQVSEEEFINWFCSHVV